MQRMWRKWTGVIGILLFCTLNLYSQHVTLKTNILYDATTSINLGLEGYLTERFSVEISGNYNPWNFSDQIRIKHWMVQPEFRYWTRACFSGHFVGIHGLFAQFNVGNIPLLCPEGVRHQGFLYGGGVSYGYLWRLTSRFGLECSLGAGYAYIDYETIATHPCGPSLGRGTRHYIGPTKAGFTLVFFIK